MDAPPAAMPDPAQSIPRPLPASNKLAVFARRLGSTLILWGVMAAAILSRSHLLFFGLIALIGGIALVEWRRMLADSLSRATACWLYLVSAGYAASLIAAPLWFFGLHEVVAVPVILVGLFVLEFGRAPDGRQTLWRIFSAAFGFVYIPLLLAFVWRLIESPGIFYAFLLSPSPNSPTPGPTFLESFSGVTKWSRTSARARPGKGLQEPSSERS